LRLKSGNLNPRNDAGFSKYVRTHTKDRMFQMEALKEVNESYQYSATQFDSLQTEFIGSMLDVSFLEISSKGFLKGATDKVILDFKSYIQGQGEIEMKYLKKIYSDLLEELDLSFEYSKKFKHFIIEGHGVFELLKHEQGIHLFYVPYSTPIPIGVSLRKAETKTAKFLKTKVIRLYDQNATLTDLRSGYTNAISISPREFKLLLFAGIQSYKQQRRVPKRKK